MSVGRLDRGRLDLLAAVIGTLVVVGSLALALLLTGSSPRDLVTWTVVVSLGVLLPGAAVVRASRRRAVSVGDDLAWSVPVGTAVALAGWGVSRAVPVPGAAWGLLVTGALLAIPSSRRRVLARPRGRWGAPTTLSVCAVQVIAITWVVREFLQWTPVDPGPHGHVYYVDSIYHATMFSELGRTGLPQYPMVAGEPLAYHWFLYAVLNRLASGAGLDRLDLMLRLAPTTLLLGLLLLVASVARQLAGRGLAAPLAAGLIGVVLAGTPTVWSAAGVGTSMVNTVWWAGPPVTLGWISGVAVVGSGVAAIRRASPDRAAAPVLLLPVLAALTSGAKSSELPVVLCGFALAAGVALLRRDWQQAARALIVSAMIVVVTAVATVTIYRGQSYGLRLAPGRSMVAVASAVFPGLVHTDPQQSYLLGTHLPSTAVAAAILLWLVPQFLRCAAIGWLVRCRTRDPGTWVTLGTGVGGLVAFFALRHPGSSELFFPISAFPIVAIGSGCGLALALPRGRRLRRWLIVGSGWAALGFGLAVVVAKAAGPVSPLVRWTATYGRSPTAADVSVRHQIWSWSWPLLVVLTGTALVVATAAVVWRRLRVAFLTGVAVTLGIGCFATAALVSGADQPSIPQDRAANQSGRPPALTRDLIATGDWLSHHARSTDVVAVNRPCLTLAGQSNPQICNSQDFTITLATGLRSDVEGWAYAGRNVEAAWGSQSLRYNTQPFWDQPRLDRELAAFSAPSRPSYDALYQSGVRWLLADRPATPLPLARMDALADRELTLGTVTLWRLRPPAGGS